MQEFIIEIVKSDEIYRKIARCMQVAENLPKTLIAMVEKELLCLQQKQLRYIANKRAQLSVYQRDKFQLVELLKKHLFTFK